MLLAECGYFSVSRRRIDGEGEIEADETSFLSLVVTEGKGILKYDGKELKMEKGDSVFIPAQNKSFAISGKIELIASKVN